MQTYASCLFVCAIFAFQSIVLTVIFVSCMQTVILVCSFIIRPFFLCSSKIGMDWENGVFNLDFSISICIILIYRLFISRHIIAFKCTENRPALCFEMICFDLCNMMLCVLAESGSLVSISNYYFFCSIVFIKYGFDALSSYVSALLLAGSSHKKFF